MVEEKQFSADGSSAIAPTIETDKTLGSIHEVVEELKSADKETIVPTKTPTISADLPTFSTDLHSYLLQNITWADTKAGFLFAASAGLLGYLHSQGLTKQIAPTLFDLPNTLGNTVGILTALALIVGAVGAFATFWPRVGGEPTGLIFWKSIAARFSSGEKFSSEVLSKNSKDLIEEKLRHSWELAKICKRKFWWANFATIAVGVGAAGAVLYLLEWMSAAR